jgi:hypothetical protein
MSKQSEAFFDQLWDITWMPKGRKRLELTKQLIASKVPLNAVRDGNKCVWFTVLWTRRWDMAKLMLDAGASARLTDRGGGA